MRRARNSAAAAGEGRGAPYTDLPAQAQVLEVATAGGRHPITIGRRILEHALPAAVAATNAQLVAVVTNETVQELHLGRLLAALEGQPVRVEWMSLPDGEHHKTLAQLERVYDRLMGWQANRRALVVAFGGGVVGDLAGLAAGTFMRGVPLVQVPTTLLAFVDSSIGGKTAVNHPQGKNSIGVFKQPAAVVMELDFLNTLPQREFRAGLLELVKHGIIRDAGLFDFLAAQQEHALDPHANFWEEVIARSCRVKRDVVQQDEREQGLRAILNFGHSLGHLLETHTRYQRFLHGEAVGVGMMFAAYASREWGLPRADWVRVRDTLLPWLTPMSIPPLSEEQFTALLAHDKKSTGEGLNFIALERLGQAVIRPGVPAQALWPVFGRFVAEHPQLLPGLVLRSAAVRPTAGGEAAAAVGERARADAAQPDEAARRPAGMAAEPGEAAAEPFSVESALEFLERLSTGWADFGKAWEALQPYARRLAAESKSQVQAELHHALVERLPGWLGLASAQGSRHWEWGALHALEQVLNPGYFSPHSVEQALPPLLSGALRREAAQALCGLLALRQAGLPQAFPQPALQAGEVAAWLRLLPEAAWAERWQEALEALAACGLIGPSEAALRAWLRFSSGRFAGALPPAALEAWQAAAWQFAPPGQEDTPPPLRAALNNLVAAAFGGRFAPLELQSPCAAQPACQACPLGGAGDAALAPADTAAESSPAEPPPAEPATPASQLAAVLAESASAESAPAESAEPAWEQAAHGSGAATPSAVAAGGPAACAWYRFGRHEAAAGLDLQPAEAQALLHSSQPESLPAGTLLQAALGLSAAGRRRLEPALRQEDLHALAQGTAASVRAWAQRHGLPEAPLLAFFALHLRLHSRPATPGRRIATAQEVFEHCEPRMGHLKQERLLLLMLDVKRRLLGEQLISQGAMDRTHFHARDIFSPAIRQGAHSVIIVHNHPSGDTDPSQQDLILTRQLQEAGALLKIPMLDHVIVTKGNYSSFREQAWVVI